MRWLREHTWVRDYAREGRQREEGKEEREALR
jgi:hypothetical protein